jgi:hypothetical protein
MKSNGEEILHGAEDAFCVTGLTLGEDPYYKVITLRFCEVAIEHTTDATNHQVEQMLTRCNHLNDKLNRFFAKRQTPQGEIEFGGRSAPSMRELLEGDHPLRLPNVGPNPRNISPVSGLPYDDEAQEAQEVDENGAE